MAPALILTTETFDNSKDPVACFEGLGSIFSERRENNNLDKNLYTVSRNCTLAIRRKENGHAGKTESKQGLGYEKDL